MQDMLLPIDIGIQTILSLLLTMFGVLFIAGEFKVNYYNFSTLKKIYWYNNYLFRRSEQQSNWKVNLGRTWETVLPSTHSTIEDGSSLRSTNLQQPRRTFLISRSGSCPSFKLSFCNITTVCPNRLLFFLGYKVSFIINFFRWFSFLIFKHYRFFFYLLILLYNFCKGTRFIVAGMINIKCYVILFHMMIGIKVRSTRRMNTKVMFNTLNCWIDTYSRSFEDVFVLYFTIICKYSSEPVIHSLCAVETYVFSSLNWSQDSS